MLKRRKFNLSRKSGFTLIELLTVISIIGILAGIIVVNLNSARVKARGNAAKGDVLRMMSEYETFKASHYNSLGSFSLGTPAGGYTNTDTAGWNSFWGGSGIGKSANATPQPPIGSQVTYKAITSSDYRNYVFCAYGTDLTTVLSVGKTHWVAKNGDTYEGVAGDCAL